MDSKTQLKVDIIIKVAEKTMSIADAEKLLGKSRRTIERYLQRYRQHGFRFALVITFVHSFYHSQSMPFINFNRLAGYSLDYYLTKCHSASAFFAKEMK